MTKPDVEDLGPLGPPPWPSRDGRPMLQAGGDHSLHRVGALSWAGSRASACGLRGAFLDPPEDVRLPRCADCWGST